MGIGGETSEGGCLGIDDLDLAWVDFDSFIALSFGIFHGAACDIALVHGPMAEILAGKQACGSQPCALNDFRRCLVELLRYRLVAFLGHDLQSLVSSSGKCFNFAIL